MRLSSLYQLYRGRYYVYEHYIDGDLIYIGKGQGGRAVDFWGRNDEWKRVVDGRYGDVEVKIVKGFEDEEEAFALEYELIRLNSNNENLTNYRSVNYVQYRYKRQTKEFIFNRIIKVVPEYLDRVLMNIDKIQLCEDLNIIDTKGRLRMWPTIRKYLIENGFVINDEIKMIDGKRCRITIIHDTHDLISKSNIKPMINKKMKKSISKLEKLSDEEKTLKSQISDNEKRLELLLDGISDLIEDTSNLRMRKEKICEELERIKSDKNYKTTSYLKAQKSTTDKSQV